MSKPGCLYCPPRAAAAAPRPWLLAGCCWAPERQMLFLGAAALLVSGALSGPSDLACSLNGVKHGAGGKCICDKPWTGSNCAKLDIKPKTKGALPAYGFAPNVTSWGGNVIRNDAGTYDLWVSEMVGGCGLKSWGSHSRVIHATAQNMSTPFLLQDEALPVWAHNAAPVRAPRSHTACPGCYYLFHIGSGSTTHHPQPCTPPQLNHDVAAALPSSCQFVPHKDRIGPRDEQQKHDEHVCSGVSQCPKEAAAACAAAANCSSFGISVNWHGGATAQLYSTQWNGSIGDAGWTLYSCQDDSPPAAPAPPSCVGLCANSSSLVHRSRSPAGPWAPLPSIPHTGCNNPAPAFAKNGTLYVLCSSSSIWRTDDPTDAGAWASVSKINLNDSPWTVGGREYLRVEDPYLYQDQHENWHLLVHLYDYRDGYPANPNQTMPVLVSGHAFSTDLHTLHYSVVEGVSLGATQPFDPVVRFDDGTVRALPACVPADLTGALTISHHAANTHGDGVGRARIYMTTIAWR
jgi:hypothetical protein